MWKCSKMFANEKEWREKSTQDCPSRIEQLPGLVALLEVKMEKVKEPSSLRCLVSSIERHLKKNDYLVSDREYHPRQTIWIDEEKSMTLVLESQHAYNKQNTAWNLCLYGIYALIDLYKKSHSFTALARSISNTYQLVCKYHMDTLSMKYSKKVFTFFKMIFSRCYVKTYFYFTSFFIRCFSICPKNNQQVIFTWKNPLSRNKCMLRL